MRLLLFVALLSLCSGGWFSDKMSKVRSTLAQANQVIDKAKAGLSKVTSGATRVAQSVGNLANTVASVTDGASTGSFLGQINSAARSVAGGASNAKTAISRADKAAKSLLNKASKVAKDKRLLQSIEKAEKVADGIEKHIGNKIQTVGSALAKAQLDKDPQAIARLTAKLKKLNGQFAQVQQVEKGLERAEKKLKKKTRTDTASLAKASTKLVKAEEQQDASGLPEVPPS